MKLSIEIDTDTDDADSLGELLRTKFFGAVDARGRPSTGCYSHFDWAANVQSLPQTPVEMEEGEPEFNYENGQLAGIVCSYYWDGDGYLKFTFPDGTVLENGDCKCSYGWFMRKAA